MLARAIRAADADAAIAVLRSGASDVQFSEVDLEATPTETSARALNGVTAQVRVAGIAMLEAARSGDISGALAALDRHRLLCAHRRGPYGVLRWGLEVERWLSEAIPGYGEDGEWYVGRPLLVTANDYEMSLYNGDTGVVIAGSIPGYSADTTTTLIFKLIQTERQVDTASALSVVNFALVVVIIDEAHSSQGGRAAAQGDAPRPQDSLAPQSVAPASPVEPPPGPLPTPAPPLRRPARRAA